MTTQRVRQTAAGDPVPYDPRLLDCLKVRNPRQRIEVLENLRLAIARDCHRPGHSQLLEDIRLAVAHAWSKVDVTVPAPVRKDRRPDPTRGRLLQDCTTDSTHFGRE